MSRLVGTWTDAAWSAEIALVAATDRLLTVAETAAILGTTERFPRRLIEERRMRFVRVGRHVRIPEAVLREFIEAGMIEPVTVHRRHLGIV